MYPSTVARVRRHGALVQCKHDEYVQADSIADEHVACTAVTQHRTSQHVNTALERVQIRIGTRRFLEKVERRERGSETIWFERKKKLAYPAAEGFEGVHRLFIACTVLVELARARREC